MFKKFVDEEKNNKSDIDITTSKINNSAVNCVYNSALVKLNLEEMEKGNDFNEIDIDKIEQKLFRLKNPELFTRENQISKAVEEIIEVPKKKIINETKILSEDKKQNQIKKQIMEKENEQDNQKRKIEMDINAKKIKEYNDKVKKNKLLLKKKNAIVFIKYCLLIAFISISLICLIIYLD